MLILLIKTYLVEVVSIFTGWYKFGGTCLQTLFGVGKKKSLLSSFYFCILVIIFLKIVTKNTEELLQDKDRTAS